MNYQDCAEVNENGYSKIYHPPVIVSNVLPVVQPVDSHCETNNDGRWWWLIIVIGIILILIVILVGFLTRRKGQTTTKICKSAEYPSIAQNESCDPNIVEVSLTASDNEVQILNGDATKLYNYNKSFPGPLIEAKAGDCLIVHFFNDICEPTTITWHGLEGDANMDGSCISQLPVQPGDSFDYRFDCLKAGLYWYHSDINPREQVLKGLYGVILVKDYDEDDCYCLPSAEKVLAFSDLKLDSKNQVDISFNSHEAIPSEFNSCAKHGCEKDCDCDACENDNCARTFSQVNGIIGNVLLTNGVYQGCISLNKNQPTRLRMVNCATDRFMKIFIEGHDLLRVGGDCGLLEKPILIKADSGLMLTTGERADIVFVPRKDTIRLLTSQNPRGIQLIKEDSCGNCKLVNDVTYPQEKLLLVTFDVIDKKDNCKLEVPLKLKKIKRIHVDHCTPVIPVTYGMLDPLQSTDNVEFFAFSQDKHGIPFDQLNKKEAPIVIADGTYIIEVTNYSPLANNFHLHGFHFQHLDTLILSKDRKERIINRVLENKDTIYIPACSHDSYTNGYDCDRSKTVVRLAVDFSSKNREIVAYGKEPRNVNGHSVSGGWVFQSHILTHAELGQQGFIQIIAECDRVRYSSYSGYSNSYSQYSSDSNNNSSNNHSTCLTRSSSNSNSNSSSRSYESSKDDLSTSLDYITKSLITCSCGSGVSSASCCSVAKTSVDDLLSDLTNLSNFRSKSSNKSSNDSSSRSKSRSNSRSRSNSISYSAYTPDTSYSH